MKFSQPVQNALKSVHLASKPPVPSLQISPYQGHTVIEPRLVNNAQKAPLILRIDKQLNSTDKKSSGNNTSLSQQSVFKPTSTSTPSAVSKPLPIKIVNPIIVNNLKYTNVNAFKSSKDQKIIQTKQIQQDDDDCVLVEEVNVVSIADVFFRDDIVDDATRSS